MNPRILQFISAGLMAILAGSAMAQMTIGAKGGLKVEPEAKAYPGQQIITLELAIEPGSRKHASRIPVREVLDRGLVVRHGGPEAMTVVYVGYHVQGRRTVRSVSAPSRLEPGAHRVPANQFLPGVEIRSGSGDGIIAGNEKLWSVDDGIISGKENLGDILDAVLPRAAAAGKGEATLVLFVVPEDARQRRKVGIKALSIGVRAP